MKNSRGDFSINVLVAGVLVALIVGGLAGWMLGIANKTPQETVSQTPQISAKQDLITQEEVDFNKAMRKLWEDHITWTRIYLISSATDAPGTENVAKRLLKNQEDLGLGIKSYYGEEAGNKLTELLKGHINTAVEVVSAAKKNDKNAQKAAEEKWYANANEIADFLSKANPNWGKRELRAMMKEHLDLTKQEAVNILGKKFDAGIADYDKIHEQILKMADMLSEGIVKQFPDKFGK